MKHWFKYVALTVSFLTVSNANAIGISNVSIQTTDMSYTVIIKKGTQLKRLGNQQLISYQGIDREFKQYLEQHRTSILGGNKSLTLKWVGKSGYKIMSKARSQLILMGVAAQQIKIVELKKPRMTKSAQEETHRETAKSFDILAVKDNQPELKMTQQPKGLKQSFDFRLTVTDYKVKANPCGSWKPLQNDTPEFGCAVNNALMQSLMHPQNNIVID
ncbi:hypothetical protein [Dongshaea marina]|uniref:hypothetical protein n=1 Tax=Dongshaea marina TaxID=2047966 RepID=UPI000D3E0F7B|nr:hypothetical protein [Dongshaea marina]